MRRKTEDDKRFEKTQKRSERFAKSQNRQRSRNRNQNGRILYPLCERWGLRIGPHFDTEKLFPHCLYDAATNTYLGTISFDNSPVLNVQEGKALVRRALEKLVKLGVADAETRLGQLLAGKRTPATAAAERNLSTVAALPKIKDQIELCRTIYHSLNRDALRLAMQVCALKRMAEAELERPLSYPEMRNLLSLDKSDKRIGHYCRVGEYFQGVELVGSRVRLDQYLSAIRLNEQAPKRLEPKELAAKAGDPGLPKLLGVEAKPKVPATSDLRVQLTEAKAEVAEHQRALDTLRRQIDPTDYEDAMEVLLTAVDKVLSLADDDEAARNDICHRVDEHLFSMRT